MASGQQRKSMFILSPQQHEVLEPEPQWRAPPVPPIPQDTAWKRRSLKRDSYTSASFKVPSAYEARMPCVAQVKDTRKSWAAAPLRPQSTYYPVAERVHLLRRLSEESRSVSWEDHPANPRQWSSLVRWFHVATTRTLLTSNFYSLLTLIVISTFIISLASSINAPSYPQYADEHNISTISSILPYALFLLGLSFAPFTACIRPVVGRKVLTIVTLALVAAFTFIPAFARNFSAIAIGRLLAGIAASIFATCAPAALLDLFAAGQRSLPFILYALTVTSGTILGSFLGKVMQPDHSVQWTQFTILICIAAGLGTGTFTRETSQELLAHHKAPRRIYTSSRMFTSFLNRQLRVVALQRSVISGGISVASISGTSFALLQVIPRTFEQIYGFSQVEQAYILLASLCGCAIGLVVLALHHLLIYRPRRLEWEQDFVVAWEKYNRQKSRPSRDRRKASLKSAMSTTQSESAITLTTKSREGLPDMSAGLAVALATEVNSLPSTQGKFVSAEKIWEISSKCTTFEELLGELEAKYLMELDRGKTTQMLEYWSNPKTSTKLTSPVMPVEPKQAHTAGDDHLAATLAALEQRDSESISGTSISTRKPGRSTLFNAPLLARQRPPPEWRLGPALAGAPLSTAGLFMLAWTMLERIPWIVPAIGLALFGCGAFLVGGCICLNLTDRFGTADIVHALTSISGVSYLFGFAFAMLSLPLFEGIGTAWAISVFGFCSLGIWVGPLGLKYADRTEISLLCS